MKKKGFTLAELLGVIVIISIVLTLVAVPITKYIKDAAEATYESQIKVIKLGTENWISDNKYSLPQNENESITITVGDLKQSGNLQTDIVNPTTGKCIPNNTKIKITKKNSKYDIFVDINSGTGSC